jgi:hypothetical protein
VLFLPFHYGYWDTPGGHHPDGGRGRAANELTATDWDPASKQPPGRTGAREVDLFALARRCHPETLRQMRWSNAKLKESATQVLVS